MKDAVPIFTKYAQDEEVTRFLSWRPHGTIRDTEAFLRESMARWDEGTAFGYVVVRKYDVASVGEHTYKHMEIIGTARTGVDAAFQKAITKASESVRNLQWFQVIDTREHIENGQIDQWHVTVKIRFRLED